MRKLISDEGLYNVANTLDQLMNMDVPARGTIGVLYEAARKLQNGDPMTLAAIRLLQKTVKRGDYVFIATGWADQPGNVATKSETDGPAGALAMARAIRVTLGGLPVIVTDDYLVDDMKLVMRANGMHVVEPEALANSLSTELGFTCVPTIAVVGVPIDDEAGHQRCIELLDRFKPTCEIAIERGAMNKHGRIHGMGGYDFAWNMAKLDHLFTEGKARGIASIGIGDGGNEIGMANIEDVIRAKVRNGNMCKCPCHSGIAPDVSKVDVLLSATISNWAGYAISMLLGLAEGDLSAMDNEELEQRVLNAYIDAEFHDSVGSHVGPSVDGCEAGVLLALIRLMRKTVTMGFARFPAED